MSTTATVVQMLIRASGLIQIALGVLFWTGNALALLPIHIVNGFIIVLLLWTLAALAAFAGVSRGLVALAFVWGIVLPVLGLTQAQLLPGDFHWLVDVLHLLVGLGALGQADALATRIKQVPRVAHS